MRLDKLPEPTIYAPFEQMTDKAMAASGPYHEMDTRGSKGSKAGRVVGRCRPAGVPDSQHGRISVAGRHRTPNLDAPAEWSSPAFLPLLAALGIHVE